jgi:aminoglycoside phosphotransferase family enzyme
MGTPPLVEFLLDPSSYPEKPRSVRLIQTHISWVFICDDYVYKVKKPAVYDFLDFSTPEKRAFYTREELRLNRRFSPEMYLDVVPISERDGRFFLGDDTAVAEYALKMRHICEDHVLYRLIRENRTGPDDLKRVGRHLARIYRTIESGEKAKTFGSIEVISKNIEENFEETERYIGGPVSRQAWEHLRSWSRRFISDNRRIFEERCRTGHIKECHGDLHLEHVWLYQDRIIIFDCIEFNERFRFGDVASDVAFLAMDLDFNGREDLGEAFVDGYVRESGDDTLRDVLVFYQVYRAHVRAKVDSFMLGNGILGKKDKEKALADARRYYQLACRYTGHED